MFLHSHSGLVVQALYSTASIFGARPSLSTRGLLSYFGHVLNLMDRLVAVLAMNRLVAVLVMNRLVAVLCYESAGRRPLL